MLQAVPGAADVKVEQVTGLPVLTVKLDRPALARYGLSVADVQDVVEIAVGGKNAGDVFEGDRRFDLVVRLPERLRADIDALRALPIPLPATSSRSSTPARRARSALAADAGRASSRSRRSRTIDIAPGPNQISRENGKRRVVVTANVRGRDLGSFVGEAQAADRREGEAAGRLLDRMGRAVRAADVGARSASTIVVPIALLLIFVLLFMSLGSAADAAAGLQRRAAGADRRRRRAAAARHPAVDQRRRRLHRAVGRRGAERPRDHRVHQELRARRTARWSTRSARAR